VDIFAVAGNEDALYSRDFPPVNTNEVRLYMTAGVSKYVRLFEIVVAAAPDPGDTTSPANPTGLTAKLEPRGVSLDWDDNPEPDLRCYNVYRSANSGSDYTLIAVNVQTSDFLRLDGH